MFGLGRQKRNSYQEPHQEDYFYDEYENEDYEEDYGYDAYPEDDYEPSTGTYNEYGRDRTERPSRRRTPPDEGRYEPRYTEKAEPVSVDEMVEEEPAKELSLQQEIERLEETVAQLKHQLEVKQTEMTNMATTLTEKEQRFQSKQAELDQQVKDKEAELDKKLQNEQAKLEQQLQSLESEKNQTIAGLNQQMAQLKEQLQQEKQDQTEALVQAQQQIAELKRAQADNEEMKAELATILIDTKKQERSILEHAELEAKGIRRQAEQEAEQVLHDASLELRVMKQEIKNYRKRLRSAQEETAQFYVRLLANSDSLLEEE